MLKKRFILFHSKNSYTKLPQLLYAGTDIVSSTDYLWESAKRNGGQKVVFQYTLDGFGCLNCKNTTWNVDKGKAFILKLNMPESRYYYPANARKPWSFVYCVFDNLQDTVEELNSKHGPVYNLGENHVLPRKLLSFFDEDNNKKQHELSAKHNFELCAEIISEMCHLTEKNVIDQGKTRSLLTQAQKMIYEKRYTFFSLEELAAQLNVSCGHICHIFRKNLHTTPKKFHEKLQIEAICGRLTEHQLPIKSIAQEFSFDDISNFCKYFKKHTCMTPGEYRNNSSIALHEVFKK